MIMKGDKGECEIGMKEASGKRLTHVQSSPALCSDSMTTSVSIPFLGSHVGIAVC